MKQIPDSGLMPDPIEFLDMVKKWFFYESEALSCRLTLDQHAEWHELNIKLRSVIEYLTSHTHEWAESWSDHQFIPPHNI